LVTLKKEDCGFYYRNSILKGNSNYIVLSAMFCLPQGSRAEIAKKIEMYHIARHLYQEFSYPNLGSLFSVKADFYKEIFSSSLIFSIYCFFLKILLRNRLAKFMMRRRPNNIFFNALVSKYVGFEKSPYSYSEKSMNILTNNGVASIDEIVEYISTLRQHLNSETEIENEIVTEPLFAMTDEARRIVNKIYITLLKK
jgi:UDP-N-acetylmuramate dehydrogenase